jgi:hypothetical protein
MSLQEALTKLPIFSYHYNQAIPPIITENLLQSWPLHMAPFLFTNLAKLSEQSSHKIIHRNGWQMDKRLGIITLQTLILPYAAYDWRST